MQIGLFGGSFNPPHLGHLFMAEWIRERFSLDEVWWIPAHQPPHKQDHRLAASQHRLAMTELATADHPAFRVSDVELAREGVSYTIDTIEQLQQAHPDARFRLIIGGDSLRDFRSWHRPDDILDCVAIIAYRRPGDAIDMLDDALRDRVRIAEAPRLDLSSTAIRGRIRAGRSVRYWVPESVRSYLEAHRLYRDEA